MRNHIWDIANCPQYRGVLISGVSFKRGSTVVPLYSYCLEHTLQSTTHVHIHPAAYLNVCLSVDISQNLLEAPETALKDAEESLGYLASLSLQLLLNVGKDDSNNLHYGNDQGTECQRTGVKPEADRERNEMKIVAGIIIEVNLGIRTGNMSAVV